MICFLCFPLCFSTGGSYCSLTSRFIFFLKKSSFFLFLCFLSTNTQERLLPTRNKINPTYFHYQQFLLPSILYSSRYIDVLLRNNTAVDTIDIIYEWRSDLIESMGFCLITNKILADAVEDKIVASLDISQRCWTIFPG